MISAASFWDWFKENSEKYFFLNQIEDEQEREKYLDELLEKLNEYSSGLYFEIGGDPDGLQELIITASGNIDLFPQVAELVESAPEFKDWKIIALKPAVKGNFEINYSGAKIHTANTWFTLTRNKTRSNKHDIKLFINDYDESQKDNFLNAALLVLDSLLGERVHALDIYIVEITNSDKLRNATTLPPLIELPQHLIEAKAQI